MQLMKRSPLRAKAPGPRYPANGGVFFCLLLETTGTLLRHAIRKYMATAVRLNEYLTPGYLIEYSTPGERQIGIVLEIHWIQRYGLSTIYVLSSESGCKMIHVKDVCVVY